jgi:hypothetical protein
MNMSARRVVVVMPFGGRDRIERRRAILNFKRVEYLVRNKCAVTSVDAAGKQDRVVYAVEVAKTAMDDIPENALRQIEVADIVIALVVEPNPNVIYEVAYRRALDRTVVLVVDNTDNLPLYLKSLGYQNWKQEKVLEQINNIAKDELWELSDFTVGIPDNLKLALDKYDGELQKGLEEALKEIEEIDRPEPWHIQALRGVVSHDSITNFYPSSIVEVSFSGDGKADPGQPAVVCDFDDGFSRLYGYADRRQAANNRPLTLAKLVDKIKKFSDPGHWQEFIEEQADLTTAVVQEDGFARATVPLRFNKEHPQREYRETEYLPCVIARAIDGEKTGPHKMYLLVVYIELSAPAEATPAYNVMRPENLATGGECHA